MDDEVLEILRQNSDNVRHILSYSQLHKLINLYNIITPHLVSGIITQRLFVCIVL